MIIFSRGQLRDVVLSRIILEKDPLIIFPNRTIKNWKKTHVCESYFCFISFSLSSDHPCINYSIYNNIPKYITKLLHVWNSKLSCVIIYNRANISSYILRQRASLNFIFYEVWHFSKPLGLDAFFLSKFVLAKFVLSDAWRFIMLSRGRRLSRSKSFGETLCFSTYFYHYEFTNRAGLIKTRNYIQYSVPSPINVVENNFCE